MSDGLLVRVVRVGRAKNLERRVPRRLLKGWTLLQSVEIWECNLNKGGRYNANCDSKESLGGLRSSLFQDKEVIAGSRAMALVLSY